MGEPLGCAVDANGDLSVTKFDLGEVTVFRHGKTTGGAVYSNGACPLMWTAGYDIKSNLIAQYDHDTFCALLAGRKTMTTLSSSGITIYFPGGTTWDGKYVALTDQGADDKDEVGIVQASLSGTTLTEQGESILTDTCDSSDLDMVDPFILGKKNTPVNDRQGSLVVGSNYDCTAVVELWHYPQGGNPFKTYSNDPGLVLAVSIGT